ncbi:hypothetical protein PGH07_01755 [Sulfurovum sp. zt1-1]|uniref:Uncharacterized protein n=1 Tax=Sulfurovum zhangzhouensis TaxID=3019067 RepID=A0ABT7QVT2_9BACT|nr:hypothetical protein [Sulfurovum zhangzhouensis]MDM5270898.1 hypothetical protein [Sulfurovum zhangzhouensis]
MKAYQKKGRLTNGMGKIEQYRTILEKDVFQSDEPHWRRISKNTITLFQVLIDQDLSDLILVLEHYPRYREWVCEHFRYAYSYSEQSADIDAASELLFMGEPFFSKQFVRNVVRKLPSISEWSLEEIKEFGHYILERHFEWHPIIVNHYCDAVSTYTQQQGLHPLQVITLMSPIKKIKRQKTYDYEAEDRDAVLDIPYMN